MRTADVLAGLHADVERHRRVALVEWRALPAAALQARPAPRSWSAIECLEHVHRANEMYLGHMERAAASAERRGRLPVEDYRPGALGRRIAAALAPAAPRHTGGARRIRFRGPTLGSYDPRRDPAPVDPAATFDRYADQLTRIGTLLERLERVDLHARSNTLLGPLLRLRLADMMAYLVAHTDRHLEQGQRAIERAAAAG